MANVLCIRPIRSTVWRTNRSAPASSVFDHADVVVFDAMYSLADAISVKADWGHSSNIVAVELCQAAQVRTLAMFHHEPAYNDAQIERVLQETRRFEQITRDGHALEVLSAWDGLELTL